MKIMMLRVGIDRGCGGILSPRYDDGSYDYIPIPESADAANPEKSVRYSDLPSRHGGTLANLFGGTEFAHYDPEFETFTYGDPTAKKRGPLSTLENGDYLIFYAGFSGNGIELGTLYAIGYFVVDNVYKIPMNEPWPTTSLSFLANNAHMKRLNADPDLVIVKGDPEKSKKFLKCKQISNGNRKTLPELAPILGYEKDLTRASIRHINTEYHESTLAWLNNL